MESALTKTKKQLLEAKKEVFIFHGHLTFILFHKPGIRYCRSVAIKIAW